MPQPYHKNLTLHGTAWCGYTTQAREELKKVCGRNFSQPISCPHGGGSVKVNYVDCDKTPGRCEGVEGYPTYKIEDGESHSGFMKADEVVKFACRGAQSQWGDTGTSSPPPTLPPKTFCRVAPTLSSTTADGRRMSLSAV